MRMGRALRTELGIKVLAARADAPAVFMPIVQLTEHHAGLLALDDRRALFLGRELGAVLQEVVKALAHAPCRAGERDCDRQRHYTDGHARHNAQRQQRIKNDLGVAPRAVTLAVACIDGSDQR